MNESCIPELRGLQSLTKFALKDLRHFGDTTRCVSYLFILLFVVDDRQSLPISRCVLRNILAKRNLSHSPSAIATMILFCENGEKWHFLLRLQSFDEKQHLLSLHSEKSTHLAHAQPVKIAVTWDSRQKTGIPFQRNSENLWLVIIDFQHFLLLGARKAK